MPKVSIIIPAYNREQYLEAAVRSALDQTMSNVEVLVIDDASSDATGAIAEHLAQEDSRVRVFHHQHNKLRSGALNTGIEHAKGDYISFLDSDDYYLLDKLERQLAFLAAHPECDGVYGDYEILLQAAANTIQAHGIASTAGVHANLIAKANGEDQDPMPEGYIPGCSVLIRKEVFQSIRFDATLRNMEDFDMWLQILGRGFVLTRLPGSTYVYRRHEDQKSLDSTRMVFARGIIEQKLKSGAYLNS